MNCETDHEIGRWIVKLDDQYAVVVVKDVEAMARALIEGKHSIKSSKACNAWDAVLDQLEFAMVKVKKNGMVKWQGGQFANSDDDTMYQFPTSSFRSD